jgi:hypothetical protein
MMCAGVYIGRPAGIAAAALALILLCSGWEGACARRLSISGTSGLLMTPTTNLVEDRDVVAGVSFVDKKWAVNKRDEYDNLAYFVTMGFLPRVEVSIRLTVLPGSRFVPGAAERSIKDRMVSAKALLVREKGRRPSLAVGSEDFTGTRRYHTLFAVMGKRFEFGPGGDFEVHVGAGADWVDAVNYPLDGVFGGVSKRLWEGGELLAEYDTEKVNVGFGLEPLRNLRVVLSAIKFESFAGSVHMRFGL